MKIFLVVFLFSLPIIGISEEKSENLSFRLSITVYKCPTDTYAECESFPLNDDVIYNLEPRPFIPDFIYSKIIDNIHFSSSLEVRYSDIGGWFIMSDMAYFDPLDGSYDKSNFAKAFISQKTLNQWTYSGIHLQKENFFYTIFYYSEPIDPQKEF